LAAATRAVLFISRGFGRLVKSVVSTWFGTFLVEGGTVVQAVSAPTDPVLLAERAATPGRQAHT